MGETTPQSPRGREQPRERADPILMFLSFHTRIRAALTTLEDLAEGGTHGGSTHKARALVDFFEGPLAWHDLDEEGSLLPRLRGVEHPPRLERMLDTCSATHRAMGEVIEDLLPCLRDIARTGIVDRERLIDAARRMRTLLEPHLKLEEQEVLPLARLLLSERDLDDIAEEMERRSSLRRGGT